MRMVGDVERFRAELCGDALGDPERPIETAIHVNQTRTPQAICSASAKPACCRGCECRLVVPLIDATDFVGRGQAIAESPNRTLMFFLALAE
jgi:hypothetical protein